MAKNFPKTIYVTIEDAGTEDEYLNAVARVEDRTFDETTRIAVYQLVEVGEVKVTRQYESPKASRRAR
jgi:hypothetical protein